MNIETRRTVLQKVTIKVFLIDDHPLILEGIKACLEDNERIEVIGSAQSVHIAAQFFKDRQPDIIMLDINMPDLGGMEALTYFRERYPTVKILILSMHDNRDYVCEAVMNGARGYILKEAPSAEVATAIEAVYHGGSYFSSGLSKALLFDTPSEHHGKLTVREQNVLIKLAIGESNKEIAFSLKISIRTVETHRKNIKKKLGISSTAMLTRYAIDQKLIN